jgi:hypothetical protein
VFPRGERSGSGNRRTAHLAGTRVAQVAAVLVVLAAVASCSSSSSSSPAPPPSSASSPSSPSPPAAGSSTAPVSAPSTSLSPAVAASPACPTSGLHLRLGISQGYAGGVYQTIVFTNVSGATCTLYGYPGVSLVSAPPYTQIGLAAKRGGTTPVKLITLAPDASANALLQIVDALNFPTATCGPAKAAYLRVYPPNQTAPVYLANASEGCAEPVQTLFISAVQAGSGSAS